MVVRGAEPGGSSVIFCASRSKKVEQSLLDDRPPTLHSVASACDTAWKASPQSFLPDISPSSLCDDDARCSLLSRTSFTPSA